MTETAISISNLSKRFPGQSSFVLDGVDLQVRAGEFVCLLGASGCGKSTLLNIMAHLETLTTGSVNLAEQPSLVFQEAALMPWLSASQNVELAFRLRGSARAASKQKALELLKLVRLENAKDKRPHELSGGMKQRVAIARALAQETSILLMDEPFAALDAINRDFLHEELRRIWQERNVTIVFVTHNVREAVRLGGRVLLMSSRPGRFIKEWNIELPEPRSIDSPDVATLAHEITHDLRSEIRKHAVA